VSIEKGKVTRREENRANIQAKYGYHPTFLSTSVVWLSAETAERLPIRWGSMEWNAMA
jgi:hypothetical protein